MTHEHSSLSKLQFDRLELVSYYERVGPKIRLFLFECGLVPKINLKQSATGERMVLDLYPTRDSEIVCGQLSFGHMTHVRYNGDNEQVISEGFGIKIVTSSQNVETMHSKAMISLQGEALSIVSER